MLIFINFHLLISGIRAQWCFGCCCRVRLITRSVNRIRLGWALLTSSFAHKLCIIFIYYRSPIFISSHEICRIKRHFYSQESDCCCCRCCQTMFRSSSAGVGASRGALSAPIYLTNLIFLHNFLYGFHVITCSRPPVGGLGKFSAVCSLSKVVVVINSLQIHTHIHMLHIQCRYKLIYLSGPLIKILFFFSPLIAGKCHQDEASVTKEGQGSSFALQSCQGNAMEFQ